MPTKMSESNISTPEFLDTSDQRKESEPPVDDGPKDRRRVWSMIKYGAKKKTNPSIFPADQFPTTFRRFSDLPLEIRLHIWRLAWPTRLIMPYGHKPVLQRHCSSRCRACKCLTWLTPVFAPSIMQACREARFEAQRVSKPIPTWLTDSSLRLTLGPSWSRAQSLEAAEIHSREEPLSIITHFNAESDLIYLDRAAIYLSSKNSSPPNHDDVLQIALDPEVPVLLDATLFDMWESPREAFDDIPNGIEALYHRYLKPRKHVYLEVVNWPTFVLTEDGWQKAIQEGLFSGHRMETRLVPIDDVPLIRKYEALRHHSIPHSMQSTEPNWDQYLWTGDHNHLLPASRENVSSAQLFMLQIADFLMFSRGSGDDRGEEIMQLNGRFKMEHPLVQQEDLRMPDFTAVILFCAAAPPQNDQQCMYSCFKQARPKYPEEDSSRLRLSIRRRLNTFLGRWGRSL